MMQAAVDPVSQTSVDVGSMDYDSIMNLGYPFCPVERFSANAKSDKLRREVERSCVKDGIPIIIEGWHEHPEWKPELYTFAFLQEHFGDSNGKDVGVSMSDYIHRAHPGCAIPDSIQDSKDEDEHKCDHEKNTLESLAHKQDQGQEQEPKLESEQEYRHKRERKGGRNRERKRRFKSDHEEEHTLPEQQPLQNSHSLPSPRSPTKTPQPSQVGPFYYAKDVSCPTPWKNHLDDILPNWLSYMNDNDLLANVKGDKAAENLMIYVGTEGTWTPAHFDQCGAIGHNIMAWAEDDSRAIWFMVSAKDKKLAEKLWRSFNHPLEYEGYFASVEELKKATFPIYVIEQKLGDFVVVPSESYHQVVNMGKATIKVSWNRLTAHCLKAAVNNVLPRYREISRPESYRIKLTIHDTLKAWTDLLLQNKNLPQPLGYFCESFKTILELFKGIVEEDWVDKDVLFKGKRNQWFSEPVRITDVTPARCDFCQADLWNRQFHCPDCTEEESAYDIYIVSRAIKAWNESEKLKEWGKYDQMSDPWENGIVPSKDKGASTATLAYMRLAMLKSKISERTSCHRCKSKRPSSPVVWTECKSCMTLFCERCLWEYYGTKWASVVGLKDGWTCPICTHECHCRRCEPDAEHDQSGYITHKEPVLWFSRPDEHSKNRGGVSDAMDQSFNKLYVFKNEGDDVDEGESSRHKTRRDGKRPAERRRTSRHQPKRIKRSDPSTLYFEPDHVKQSTLSDSLDMADTEMFQLMHDLGLGRALRSMEAIQCDDGKYYSDVFQLEAKMQTMGSRYHSALDGLRLDILEKFALRRVADDDNDPNSDNDEGSLKAQEPEDKELKDKEPEDKEPEDKESEDEESEDKESEDEESEDEEPEDKEPEDKDPIASHSTLLSPEDEQPMSF
ncbi:hypothetical protein BGZ81_006982 [Podila clonocystis]|nr:hypothetical protein BGZ81_006982 [Podila clonocystis]